MKYLLATVVFLVLCVTAVTIYRHTRQRKDVYEEPAAPTNWTIFTYEAPITCPQNFSLFYEAKPDGNGNLVCETADRQTVYVQKDGKYWFVHLDRSEGK